MATVQWLALALAALLIVLAAFTLFSNGSSVLSQ
jgi:hypothetical protein